MKIRPLHDRVLLMRLSEEEKSKGGIIIPDTAKEKPIEGEVIAVGNGRTLDDGTVKALEVKAGDKVLFGKCSGTEVQIDGEERLILREDDILAVGRVALGDAWPDDGPAAQAQELRRADSQRDPPERGRDPTSPGRSRAQAGFRSDRPKTSPGHERPP